MLYTVLLFLSLFLFFYSLAGGKLPEIKSMRDFILHYGISFLSAVIFFVVAKNLFFTPLAGLLWSILGWFAPGWLYNKMQNHKQVRLREMAKSFISAATGLFAAGQTTVEVIKVAADRFPEPFAKEFNNMLTQRKFNKYFCISEAFEQMSDKYNLPEFKAVGAILSAAEKAGGPTAAARGFKRLGFALKQRDKLMQERKKATYEPKIAAVITILFLLLGLIADATVWRDLYNESTGKLVMTLSSGLIVGMVLVTNKIIGDKDLS